MLQERVPVGPTKAPETLPDRTRILNPVDYWPDPLKCPDWPQAGPFGKVSGIIGKRGAEMRLEALGQRLNRGGYKLRVPSSADCEREISRLFRPTGSDWGFLGIPNLSLANRALVEDADLIVEACHIRGYLRKLEAQEGQASEAADRQRLARARQTLDNYRTEAPARIEHVKALSEAAARHESQQRLDDEAAWHNLRGAKQHLDGLYREAVRAAHELGLSVPDAPEFLSEG